MAVNYAKSSSKAVSISDTPSKLIFGLVVVVSSLYRVVSDPVVPVVANLDAEPKRDAASSIEALVGQVTAPVRWEQVVRRLASEGVDTYVEVGPGSVLGGLIRRIHRGARVLSVSDPESVSAVASTLAG